MGAVVRTWLSMSRLIDCEWELEAIYILRAFGTISADDAMIVFFIEVIGTQGRGMGYGSGF